MKKSIQLLLASSIALSASYYAQAKEVKLDKVAVIVNQGVVLESEVLELIKSVKQQAKGNQQSLPSDRALRTQVIDKLIDDSIILQVGKRMGVQVSDAQLDDTLTNMATEDKLTLEQFRQAIVADELDYEKFRESVRTEIISGEVRRASVSRRIYISPQDISNLMTAMDEQKSTDEEYRLGHILIEFPAEPTQEDMSNARSRADKVIELLNNGSDFAQIAIASSGGQKALEGGDLGWRNINEIPTLFSEIIDGKKKDTILGPIRTGLGFSIVKVLDIRGIEIVEIEELNARHILIIPTIILSEGKAETILQGFLEQIAAGEADFSELAKEHSDGPTSVNGGEMDWFDPKSGIDPAFVDALSALEVDEYSKPFRTSYGWHITQLTGRRMLDATAKMDEQRALQILHNRKFGLESARWIRELRDEAYIEIVD